jgi:hypothetical protein
MGPTSIHPLAERGTGRTSISDPPMFWGPQPRLGSMALLH